MKDLTVGDFVLSGNAGQVSRVYAFGHRNPRRNTEFLQIWTKSDLFGNDLRPLEITKDHLLFAWQKENTSGAPKAIRADNLRVGELIQTLTGSANVTHITQVNKTGIYAPLTLKGTLVVNGLVTSSYVSLSPTSTEVYSRNGNLDPHSLLHMVVSPFRLVCGFTVISSTVSLCQDEIDADGMPVVIGYGLNLMQWILEIKKSSRLLRLLKSVALVGVLIVTGTTYVLEQILQTLSKCKAFSMSAVSVLMVTVLWMNRPKQNRSKV